MSDTATETPTTTKPGERLRACGFCEIDPETGERPQQPMSHIREHSQQMTDAGQNTASMRGPRRVASAEARKRRVSPNSTCATCQTRGVHKTVGDVLECSNTHGGKQFATWMTEELTKLWEEAQTDPEERPLMVRTMLRVEGEDRPSKPLQVMDFDPSTRTITIKVGEDAESKPITRKRPIRDIRLINDAPAEAVTAQTTDESSNLPPVPETTVDTTPEDQASIEQVASENTDHDSDPHQDAIEAELNGAIADDTRPGSTDIQGDDDPPSES